MRLPLSLATTAEWRAGLNVPGPAAAGHLPHVVGPAQYRRRGFRPPGAVSRL